MHICVQCTDNWLVTVIIAKGMKLCKSHFQPSQQILMQHTSTSIYFNEGDGDGDNGDVHLNW